LQVRDSTGALQTLKRLAPHKAERTLGVRLAPDGNNKAELVHLRDLATKWANRMRTGHLPRHLVWQSLQTTILKSLSYPLSATSTLTENQCYLILKPVLAEGLSRSGIVRSFPRDVVHGPVRFGGLGITNLFCEQKLTQIELLLKFSTHPTHLTSQVCQLSMEQFKMEVGIEASILSLPFAVYKHLVTPCLLTSMWSFLSNDDMRIEDSVTEIPLLHEQDVFLMNAFISAGIRGNNLHRLNRCRLFLQVVSLAQVSTWDGLHLRCVCARGELFPMEEPTYD